MAATAFTIVVIAMVLVTVPYAVQSQSCKSHKLGNNKTYALCENHNALDSQIHYTYNATNSSLSIAFVATPSKSGGWVSWAINPTGTGMVGAQAFVAYEFNNSIQTKTLNITGYRMLTPGKLAFDFWDVSAEKNNDVITLYASLAVPNNKTVLNQVWQVGPDVDANGEILPHAFSGENLLSKSVLSLTGAPVPTSAPAPSPSTSAPSPSKSTPSPSGIAPAPGNSTNGSLGKMKVSGGFDFVLISAFMASLVVLCLF
ncbi:hypothetical protein QQ045_006096 [Rhodiola kirilowii]